MSNERPTKKNHEILFNNGLTRRDFLKKTIGFSGAGLFALPVGWIGKASFIHSDLKSMAYPFRLGVASGDPLPNGVVLWTRLAPQPLKRGGGMPTKQIDVHWEVSKDRSFQRIIKHGKEVAGPAYAHSVHVEVEGLEPGQWYYYRFKAGSEMSPIGRTKTAPALDASLDELNFAFASCQKYFEGYYTAYDHMVKEDIDVVFFLGDYIYEYPGQGKISRGHLPDANVRSLEEYRVRYGQYKSDASLQAAHAAFPWIVTLDDHEVKSNWGGKGPPYDHNEDFLARRAVALQAYYEHMPLRKSALPHDINMQIYRQFTYGNLAKFNVLDTRQFRTDFVCGGKKSNCKERLDRSRTMLGQEQEKWLFNNLKKSETYWNILPQQVLMAQIDMKSGTGTAFSMDKWDGYAATRNRLFDVIKENNIDNMVVLTGDSHKNWANNLLEDFSNPDSPIIATEFMGTSITSGGDGTDFPDYGEKLLKENPYIKFFNDQRGYVRCKITPQKIKADFRVVPYVSKPGSSIHTRATFEVKNGQPGVNRV